MVEWECSYHSGTNGKSPSKPWKTEYFPVLALFSTCPFLKLGVSTPIKILMLKLTGVGLRNGPLFFIRGGGTFFVKNCLQAVVG